MTAIDVLEAIHTARALRRSKPDPVPEAAITVILEVTLSAPGRATSGCEVAARSLPASCGTGWQEGMVLAGRASRTALGAAVHRAVHQLVDVPKVFDDPLAGRILGAEGGELFRSRLQHPETAKRLRMLIAARSRIAEDAVREAVRSGVRQYVLLGAGLDTFAYRNPYQAAGLLVFEVDHPQTQAWKRARLAEAGIEPPPSVRFAALDFECGALRAGLETAGFRFDQPAVFAWLGVVPYLDRPAICRTLALVASGAAPTEIVFDYVEPPHALGPAARAAYESAARRVAEAGEPWRTFFTTDELAGELRRLGFNEIEDLDGPAIARRWSPDRTDTLALAHVVRARRVKTTRKNGGSESHDR